MKSRNVIDGVFGNDQTSTGEGAIVSDIDKKKVAWVGKDCGNDCGNGVGAGSFVWLAVIIFVVGNFVGIEKLFAKK